MTERLWSVIAMSVAALTGCGSPRSGGEPGARRVEIVGLELQLEGAEERESLVVLAERAVLDDLPGRGEGRLTGVRAVLGDDDSRDRLEVTADRARLIGGERLSCERATVRARGLSLRARTADIGAGRSVVATDLRASLRPLEREEGGQP